MLIIVICKVIHHIKSSCLLDLGDGIENTSRKKYERAQQGLKLKTVFNLAQIKFVLASLSI
jgi:hypothetical protein